MVIFLCNIQFVFMIGKDSFLTLIQELFHREISKAMSKQLTQRLMDPEHSLETEDMIQTNSDQSAISDRVDNFTYYLSVFFLFTLQALLAIFINDLTFIFGIIAAFTECTISFTLPGLMYVISAKKAKVPLSFWKKTGAMMFSLFGVLYFCVSNYFNFKNLDLGLM